MRKMKSKKGLTLIELMIVSMISAVVILCIWRVFISSLNAVNEARDMNTATDDLKDVLEKMKSVPFADIAKVFDTTAEVNENNSFIEDGADQVNAATIGGFLLRNERIVISYPQIIANPNRPILLTDMPDPLEVEVTITWQTKGRVYTKTYEVIRTRML